MPPTPRRIHLVLFFLGACAAPGSVPPPVQSPPPTTETISIRVSEGTALSFDRSADGRVVFDLLGQLWESDGGQGARALTDAVRDTAEDLDPSLAPDGRRIVFRAERRGRTGLWLLERGDSSPRQLTLLAHPDGFDGSAAWSPDGRTIAFSRVAPVDEAVSGWASTIQLLDLADDSERTLEIEGLPSASVRDPAWHPDGRRIAFVEARPRRDRGGRIWIVSSSGGMALPLTAEGTEALAPAFAPDGRRIAFFAPDSAGRIQVWVRELAAPNSASRRLTSHPDVSPTRIRWATDGEHLAYAADGRLWDIAASGGDPKEIPFTAELTFQRARPELPPVDLPEPGKSEPVHGFAGLALAPDGRHIAMIALGKLWVMPVPGSPRAVADVPVSARYLTWRSGDRVAWSAGPFGEEDIFATDLESGATHRVTHLPGREVFPAYSPDGRNLAFVHADGDGPAHLRVADARVRDLRDLSRTTLLDSIELGWTASNADVPVWSPDSDALLRTAGGWNPGSRTEGIVTTLRGERSRLSGFPDSPLYLQWTRGHLVYIRHARLWSAPIDGSGAPALPLGDGPAISLSAAADGSLLYLSEGGLRLRSADGREQVLGWPLSFTPPVPAPLLIRGARIVDGTGAPPSRPSDILVENGRIAAIAPVGALDTRLSRMNGGRILDATGKFVTPGFMDLHAHEYRPDLLPGFLRFGVTTVRDQGAPLAPLIAAAEAIAAGVSDGPRVMYGGMQLYTDWAWDTEEGLGIEPEADADHARRAIALARLFGAQHVKTRTFRRWDINARLIAEAHRNGMRATGHCAHPLALVAAGMDAQEHLGFCPPRGGGLIYDDIVQLFRAARIAVVPTITYADFAARLDRAELLEMDPELAPYLPDRSSFDWMLGLDSAGAPGWRASPPAPVRAPFASAGRA